MYILDELHQNLGEQFSRISQTLQTTFRFPSTNTFKCIFLLRRMMSRRPSLLKYDIFNFRYDMIEDSCFCSAELTIIAQSLCLNDGGQSVLTAAVNRSPRQLGIAKGGSAGHLPIQPVHNLTKALRSYCADFA